MPVVELYNPHLDGDTLTFDVKVLEGASLLVQTVQRRSSSISSSPKKPFEWQPQISFNLNTLLGKPIRCPTEVVPGALTERQSGSRE
jgi:hypothetical protein